MNTDLVIIQLDRALAALTEAKTLQDTKKILDVAAAAEIYARRQHLGEEAARYASEIKLRAEIKLGEMLKEMPKAQGKRTDLVPTENEVGVPTLSDLGIDRKLSSRAQMLAGLSPEKQDAVVNGDLSVADVQREKRRAERQQRIIEVSGNEVNLGEVGRFPVIYADPPWRYEYAVSTSREIENQYPTATLDDLKSLAVPALDDCVLFLWATSPKLEEAIDLIRAWGFTYRTSAVWDKEVIGMGYYFRQQHELLLVATKGSLPVPLPEARASSVIRSPRGKHSAKPECVYGLIEAMYPDLPKIELFARTGRAGWALWGNEVKAA
ncbi:MAG: MT-A70 family methyltransferase [Gammaproteobacteria bacterium]